MMAQRNTTSQVILVAVLAALMLLTLFPFLMTLLLSQKPNAEIYRSFWSVPQNAHPEFYSEALSYIAKYIVNSIIIGVIVVAGTLLLGSLSGYVFARLEFRGKGLLFILILALMMIPGILTLIPAYKWYNQLPFLGGNNWLGFGGQGLLDSRWVLIIPAITGSQILAIFLCRTFFEQIPASLFEAARIDGASELQTYLHVALPLSLPVLATAAIITFINVYNDYVWPLVTITDDAIQVFSVGVTKFDREGNLDYGPMMAGYVLGSLPLIAVFLVGMRYYVEGLTKGGIKA